jgi:hypothetical protein
MIGHLDWGREKQAVLPVHGFLEPEVDTSA